MQGHCCSHHGIRKASHQSQTKSHFPDQRALTHIHQNSLRIIWDSKDRQRPTYKLLLSYLPVLKLLHSHTNASDSHLKHSNWKEYRHARKLEWLAVTHKTSLSATYIQKHECMQHTIIFTWHQSNEKHHHPYNHYLTLSIRCSRNFWDTATYFKDIVYANSALSFTVD